MPARFTVNVTYKVESGPPAETFESYGEAAQQSFDLLLKSDPAEASVQGFLEQNPSYVPGAFGPGSRSGHYPHHCALISQPRLPGLRSRQPDFAWLACHSSGWFPVLIEIERPAKRVFTTKRSPTAELTQARHQLVQWRAWFGQPENVAKFVAEYGIPDDWVRRRRMQVHTILVYGRRSEFTDDPELARERAEMFNGTDEELLSFDRLAPDRNLSDAVTVRAKGSGRFEAVAVPPTLRLGPTLAGRLSSIDGLEQTVDVDTRMSAARREFLKERIPYWRDWGREPAGITESWAFE